MGQRLGFQVASEIPTGIPSLTPIEVSAGIFLKNLKMFFHAISWNFSSFHEKVPSVIRLGYLLEFYKIFLRKSS